MDQLIDADPDGLINRRGSLLLFPCCFYCYNQRLLIELMSSIADADASAVAADRSTAVVVAAIDPELL